MVRVQFMNKTEGEFLQYITKEENVKNWIEEVLDVYWSLIPARIQWWQDLETNHKAVVKDYRKENYYFFIKSNEEMTYFSIEVIK